MQNALGVLGVLVIATAGWVSVSRLGYRLRWTPVIGLLLSLGSHWSLFVVRSLAEQRLSCTVGPGSVASGGLDMNVSSDR
jgi:hypothetical protein